MMWILALVAGSTISEHPVMERAPMGFVLRAPELSAVERNMLADELRTALEYSTTFRVEDLTELVELAEDPISALVRDLRQRNSQIPELVLLVTLLPASSPERFLLARQLVLAREAFNADPSGARDFVAHSGLDEIARNDLEHLVGERLLPELQAKFVEREVWRPQGQLQIDFAGSGFELRLDGRVVAAQVAGPLRLEHLSAGVRQIALAHPDYAPVDSQVKVLHRATADFVPTLLNLRVAEAEVPRRVVAVSGAALALSGLVFLTMALVRATDPPPGCILLAEGGRCEPTDPGFARVGGLPVAPLGYSLVGAGAIMTGGVFGTDSDTQPWWFVVAGLGVGALAFGASVWAE